MHTLTNDLLTIQVATKGAELQSIFHQQHKLEYMWSAGEAWPKKSPVLFPIVGGLKNTVYEYHGKQYSLPRHGFARDHNFVLEAQTDTQLIFSLSSTDETKSVYPFDFTFKIIYTLENATLNIAYTVENSGTDELYFSVGAHPAFAVPLEKHLLYEDYYLQFDEEETTPRWPLTKEGLIQNAPIPFLEKNKRLPLRKSLFEKDAIVFKDLKSTSMNLLSDKSPHGLTVAYDGFPYMGLWAANGADFVCIEPWCGIADTENASGNLAEKEGIIKLATEESWSKSYSIKVF